MNVQITKYNNIFIASIKSGYYTFQGAGKTEQEATSVMWKQYNTVYLL